MRDQPTESLFRFRVSGIEDNTASRRNFVVRYDETFEFTAESVGDFHRWSTYWANVAPRSGGGPEKVAEGCMRCLKRRDVRNRL